MCLYSFAFKYQTNDSDKTRTFKSYKIYFGEVIIHIHMRKLSLHICIIPGKKSASWHLVAVLLGLKTMPRGKKRRKMAINGKREICLNSN